MDEYKFGDIYLINQIDKPSDSYVKLTINDRPMKMGICTSEPIQGFTGIELFGAGNYLYVEPVNIDGIANIPPGMKGNTYWELTMDYHKDIEALYRQVIERMEDFLVHSSEQRLRLLKEGVPLVELQLKLPSLKKDAGVALVARLAHRLNLMINFTDQQVVCIKFGGFYTGNLIDLTNENNITQYSFLIKFKHKGRKYVEVDTHKLAFVDMKNYKVAPGFYDHKLLEGYMVEPNLGYLVYNENFCTLIDKQKFNTYAIGLTVLDPTELTGEMIDKLTSEVVRIYG